MNLVFQDWWLHLPMQQQSVLVLACRGPDGMSKFHPSKEVVCYYRATVLKAAYLGRPMAIGEGDNTTFMTLKGFENKAYWNNSLEKFFNTVDSLPHHYYMHLMHGAEIIGYHHPVVSFGDNWLEFYIKCCKDLHVTPETKQEMDNRLNDWRQEHWN